VFPDGTHVGFEDQVVLGDAEVTSDILPWLNPLLWWLITALSSLGVPFLPYLLGQLYKRRVAGGLLGAEEEDEGTPSLERRGLFKRVLINPQDIALLEQQAARRAQAQVEERLQVGVVVVTFKLTVTVTVIGTAKPRNPRGSQGLMELWSERLLCSVGRGIAVSAAPLVLCCQWVGGGCGGCGHCGVWGADQGNGCRAVTGSTCTGRVPAAGCKEGTALLEAQVEERLQVGVSIHTQGCDAICNPVVFLWVWWLWWGTLWGLGANKVILQVAAGQVLFLKSPA
jgi:hypothetical protein